MHKRRSAVFYLSWTLVRGKSWVHVWRCVRLCEANLRHATRERHSFVWSLLNILSRTLFIDGWLTQTGPNTTHAAVL